MSESTEVADPFSDLLVLKVAREIAMDLHPIETILKNHSINAKQWETMQRSPRFQQVLTAELAAWNSAANTEERVKLKAGAMIEEWLPELFSRMHDKREALNAKIEAGKLLSKLAGMGVTSAGTEFTGERFSVTINLGADQQLKIDKPVGPMIEGEVL